MIHSYGDSHRDRINLLVHLVAVPAFVGGALTVIWALFSLNTILFIRASVLLAISLGLQGWAHYREENRPTPFSGPVDLVTRIAKEQFWEFPRFVFSGEWLQRWREKS